MALEVGYQGNHSSHQLFQPDDNPCPNLATPNPTINCNSLRAYPDIGSISGTASFGYRQLRSADRETGETLLEGACSSSVPTPGAMRLANTRHHAQRFERISRPIAISNYNLDYSSAAWDIRQNFTTGFTYDLPFGRGKQFGANLNRAADMLLGGWQVNGILTLHTGQPYTVSASGLPGRVGGLLPRHGVRANPNAAPAGGRTPSEWFNTANFTAPASLTQGNRRRQHQLRAAAPESGLLRIQGLRVYRALQAAVPDGSFQPRQYAAVQFPGQRLRRCQFRQGDQHFARNRTARSVRPEIPFLRVIRAAIDRRPYNESVADFPMERREFLAALACLGALPSQGLRARSPTRSISANQILTMLFWPMWKRARTNSTSKRKRRKSRAGWRPCWAARPFLYPPILKALAHSPGATA